MLIRILPFFLDGDVYDNVEILLDCQLVEFVYDTRLSDFEERISCSVFFLATNLSLLLT